jgi:hypothetical protein
LRLAWPYVCRSGGYSLDEVYVVEVVFEDGYAGDRSSGLRRQARSDDRCKGSRIDSIAVSAVLSLAT